MMFFFYNYVIVDIDIFLFDIKYFEMIYSMCKKVFIGVVGEDVECYVVKLLEVIIL